MVNSSSTHKSKKSQSSITIEEDPDAIILGRGEGKHLSPLENSIGKFARLKYGDNQEILFNIDCQVLL
jgi:hypothetical protein